MTVKSIQIEYSNKNGFTSSSIDGVRHTKALPYVSIVQAVEGNYGISLDNGKSFNTEDCGFFIAPSDVLQTITHNTDKHTKKIVCRWVFLKILINGQYSFDELYDFPVIIPQPYKKEMHALFDRLFSTDDPFEETVCYYEIVRLLHLLSRKSNRKNSQHIEKAIAYVKKNYKDKITVQDIASHIGLSASHLHSVFRKDLNTSPINYLNKYRLSIAAEELLKTDRLVNDVAYSVGINDSVYFNKLFKKTYQASPTQYRKTYKNGFVMQSDKFIHK